MYPRANKHAMDAHLEVRRLRGGRGCSTLLGPQSPFLAQTTYNSTGLSPKRHCGTKWVKVEHFVFGRLLLSLDQMFISRKRYTPCSVFGRKTKKKKNVLEKSRARKRIAPLGANSTLFTVKPATLVDGTDRTPVGCKHQHCSELG